MKMRMGGRRERDREGNGDVNEEWKKGKKGRWKESNKGIIRGNVMERECDEFQHFNILTVNPVN